MKKAYLAEFIGTFWLVLGGCGAAVFAGKHIGFFGVSMAFGLTVLSMAYALGHISGGHFNPAVSVGLAVSGRFSSKELPPYIISQCLGAIAAAVVIYVIVVSSFGGNAAGSFAANGYGDLSPDKFSMVAGFICETVLTCGFLLVIIGVTDSRAPAGFAPLAIGLCLTLIHLISIPVTNTSVNPARSTSQAIFVGGWAIKQLWMFWVAPIAGAVLAGIVYKFFKPGK